MKGFAKKVEIAANIAIILVGIVVGVLAIRHFAAGRSETNGISAGKKLALTGVGWQNNKRNIVFALSTNCHFCTESAQFYRELTAKCKRENIRTIAVFPQKPSAVEAYLKNLSIQFDEVRELNLAEAGIAQTPTLLLVGDDGVVKKIWIGKLPANTEAEVFVKAAS
jgi:peroxiredoxin